ncbi:MAG TPA: protein kinase, partial [Candidatus Obscuribacter sp.]|nr:protein kinase [Candidatus Obscuribacter sp.]
METTVVIPNYEIVGQIGESSQAVVFRAYHKKHPERLLVLKMLKADFLSESKKAQFRQKVEQLRVLRDPLVIAPISFDVTEGVCFLTQDFFDGITLNQMLKKQCPLSLPDFFRIACSLARAVDRIHDTGIIHGGLKP